MDDDIYFRPVHFFQYLAKQQRAQMYLGSFDYSGEVIRDADSAHYLDEAIFDNDVFPPYARGAALVLSIDLVREI